MRHRSDSHDELHPPRNLRGDSGDRANHTDDSTATGQVSRSNRGPFPAGVTRGLSSVSTGPVTPITPAVVNRVHPTRAATIDPERMVWEPEAFPAFARSDDYQMARQILGSAARRWRDPKQPAPPRDPLLKEVRCGEPAESHDGRCAVRLTPCWINGAWVYSSPSCWQRKPGHRNTVPARFLEAAVVRMTAAAYKSHRLEAAVRSVRARTEAMHAHVLQLTEAWTTATDLCNAASDRVLEAELASDSDARDHWNEQTIRHRVERQAARERLDAAQQELTEAQTPRELERRLGTLRTIGGRIPELLTTAASDRTRLRELLGILVRDVSVRAVGVYLALVEVTFPNGSSARELITVQRIISSQPERAIALARTRAGVAPETIAEELNAGQTRREGRVILTPKLTRTLALVGKYFETETPRTTAGATADAIAQRVGSDFEAVWFALIAGTLGPATVDEAGIVRVAPTEQELEEAFPAYALRQTELRADWAPGEAVLRPVLEKHFGITEMAAAWRRRVDPTSSATDLTGRNYYRLSAFGFTPGEAQDVLSRYIDRPRIDPAAIADAVVAAGYQRESARDFQPARTIFETVRGAGIAVGPSALRKARQSGTLLQIPCRIPLATGHGKPVTVLVWCPRAVCEHPTKEGIRAWLKGELTPPSPTAAP